MSTLSSLAKIAFRGENGPFFLFNEWLTAAKKALNSNLVLMQLATAQRDGVVSNRTVVLRDIRDNNLVFMTDGRSRKIEQIKENPKVALCVLFVYNVGEECIYRQIRIEGQARELSREVCEIYYNRDDTFAKIRSHLCHQGQTVNSWEELKEKHDKIVKKVENGTFSLQMPDHQVAYEVVPSSVEFYFSTTGHIADRLIFQRTDDNNWNFRRIAT